MARLRRIICVAAVAMVALAAPAAGQADDEFVLQNVDATGFPLVRAMVSGPAVQGELDDAFVVTEDGEPIDVDVVRLRGDELNVVVALDVSGSMEGDPLLRAKAAVAELLATLPESVPVAIVGFGDTANVQSNFTTDRDVTLGAVNGLIAAGQTALFDGIQLGLAQLAVQGGSGALVVLADGADSVSSATLDSTVANLAAAEIDVSIVALQTRDFTAESVQAMADAAGGSVLAIDDSVNFAEALRSIGAGLGNSYEVRWRSKSTGDSADVAIALASDPSRSVTASFDHPEVRQFVPEVATDTRTVPASSTLSQPWVPLVAALFVSLGGVTVIMMARNSETAVERREERNAGREARTADRKRKIGGVQERLNDISAQVLEANDRGRSLDDTLDRAGLAVRSNEFVVFCAGVMVASLLLGVLLFGIPYFLIAGIVPAFGIPSFLKFMAKRRTKKFVGQLGDTLQLITGSLTAGYGLGQTLDSVARETESPTSDEFSRVVMETRLGRSLEDALDAMSLRINAPDFDWVVDAIKIQSSVGGNLSEIIDQVGETIRARVRIKRQVDALTAEGKISALVLFVLPFGLCGFIAMSNPAYIKPLFSTGTGYVLSGLAALLLTLGGLWLKKLVNPEF